MSRDLKLEEGVPLECELPTVKRQVKEGTYSRVIEPEEPHLISKLSTSCDEAEYSRLPLSPKVQIRE